METIKYRYSVDIFPHDCLFGCEPAKFVLHRECCEITDLPNAYYALTLSHIKGKKVDAEFEVKISWGKKDNSMLWSIVFSNRIEIVYRYNLVIFWSILFIYTY